MNPRMPVPYRQPKLHKENNPIKPILSYINAPTYKLCKYLSKELPPLINFKSEKEVTNNIELV